MWKRILHAIHHLFDPHCSLCSLENEARKEERIYCKTCEILQHQLEVANFRNEQIIKSVLSIPEPEPEKDYSNLQPIRPRFVPWRVRRQAIETLDREQARTKKEKAEHAAATSTAAE